jgi:probable DNA repair protein
VRGGASVFENQAACPFRAFAIHRLGARVLEEGRPGLDARERGNLLHRALAHLWGDLETHARLLALDAGDLDAAATRAVSAALESLQRDRPDALSEPFAAIERDRIRALLGRLLDLERERAPFRVVEREAPRALEVAGLRVNARVDRVDMLDDGRRVILDYKTGRASLSAWIGDRPDAPQLPLYAVTDSGDVAAVAFVPVRARDVRFLGLSRDEDLLPGVKILAQAGDKVGEIRDWPALLSGWRATLDALAREFLAGRAAVAPKQYPLTCQYCELGPLCRVKELLDRGPVSVEEEGGEDDGDE